MELAVAIEFEEVGGVIRRPAGGLGLGVGETPGGEVEALDVGVHEADGRGGGDLIIDTGGEELDLGAVGAAPVAHGRATGRLPGGRAGYTEAKSFHTVCSAGC